MVILLGPARSAAQIPEKFQNLQFFPKDIERRELLNNMRDFSFALGVRCEYCHVGEGLDLSHFDFISDTKTTKKIAREMLRMVEQINSTALPRLQRYGKDPANLVTVRCITCHRGQPRPLMIEEVLRQVIASDGIEAAVEKYKALRERYYGEFTYDFSAQTIDEFGFQLVQEDRPADALAILQLALEYFPGSANGWYYLGRAQESLGHTDEAVAAYRKALEIRPSHSGAALRLKEIGIPPIAR